MERAFWVVSIIIALSDAIFIYVNYVAGREALFENLAEQGAQQEITFHLNLRNQGLHMLQFATYLANQPEVRDLFIAGRNAVMQEGGGSGGARAAALRQQLYDQVSPGWQRLTGDYRVRQLHFHLGPGDTSFLRVHSPRKFGDDLAPIRHTITHAIRDNKTTHGFESGRVYAGIRGVVPISVEDPASGRVEVVGALEAGSSFSHMLDLLRTDTGAAYGVLMTRDFFYKTHWPEFAARMVAKRPLVDDWFIEGTADDVQVRDLLADPQVRAVLGQRRPVISYLSGRPNAVYSFPFRDFLRLEDRDLAPIGNVLVWRDASAVLGLNAASLRNNLLLGAAGFLIVETLLFIAWRLARGRLQRVIDTKVAELSETNRRLEQEIDRRTQSERKLKNYQTHLEALVENRTRSLRDTVSALEREADNRLAVEQTLASERDRAQVTLRSIVDGVITADAECRVEYMNPSAEQLTGWSLDVARGRPLQAVFRARDMERGAQSLQFSGCLTGQCERHHGENTELTRRDGSRVTVEHSLAPIRDADGRHVGLVLVFHDDTEARELAVQLSYQASHDALTGLRNRRAIEHDLQEALTISRSDNVSHAFLYIDLDQFKVVNDTCGHVAGDELLRQIAKLLQQKTRQSDVLARLGGDEFGLLLRTCPLDQARKVADGLLQTLGSFVFVWEDRSFRIGASIGLIEINAELENVAAILSAADTACYLAKEKGRSRVHLYLPDDGEMQNRRGEMQWVSRLQLALEEDRFVLFSQPIVPIAPQRGYPVHQEVLVRMLDEEGELIAPTAFIPAAERYGIMTRIDAWIIDRTLQLIRHAERHWPNSDIGIFNINLSGETMADEGLLDFIREHFQRYRIDPRRICFEVTETAAIANMASAIDLMSELKRDGCSFALDDFGSGLSSFGYLKALPVDYLKIDGSFVRQLDSEEIDRVMVRAINEVGHAMQLKTIAEFVESDAIMDILRDMGVDYAQGFSIGRPTMLFGTPEAAA